MVYTRGCRRRYRATSPLVRGAAALVLVGVLPAITGAQQAGALVFDGVTVVDVEHGQSRPDQRVVIQGNRIRALGPARTVRLPQGARVVDAHGKYLMPGLWDLHLHSGYGTRFYYPLLIANGVTGFRDPGSTVPLDSLRRWRREILAGTRIGPPRQILSGPLLNWFEYEGLKSCDRAAKAKTDANATCFVDAADGRHVVDSLVAAGVDMIKIRYATPSQWAVIAAEARRLGVPFGGHAGVVDSRPPQFMTMIEASDRGARLLDHAGFGDFPENCVDALAPQRGTASVERCRPTAEHLRRNNSWWVPTMAVEGVCGGQAAAHWQALPSQGLPSRTWLRDPIGNGGATAGDYHDCLRIVQQVGMPIVAGTDMSYGGRGEGGGEAGTAGFRLQEELAIYASQGLSPLEALQTATLNPAKMWHATDSLGTVARGKLADLVLLDADPLADITNITMIHAVVANGRYFDRPTLDSLILAAQHPAQESP